ncbi:MULTISPECIES: S-methyl-5'-thioadenosine phosphorylase [Prochlorococcus]|uniref:S-methyl-5'-thioadenosine phosphorylase n=1 Tax=Prochlorococcus marinus str. MIT 9314 TaxID=167548 RepID=A0A0A2AHK5_PROMR|nr:S-methyl-5'-thioadenosine phosphorylase [Prochlorococcus marinus]KGG00292.1 5'-methylthioadenosine phosphorylase [Prochlorococcus marinus str. MIT 9314]
MESNNLNNSKLGVLGGSGFYSIEDLTNVKEINVETPYGETSDSLRLGELNGIEVVFLARHGRNHTFTPSEVPYRANIWAMKSLGVKWIISASAVGSLKEEIRPLDIVLPDQFIDRTHDRPVTFFGDGAVAHVALADPFCSELIEILKKSTEPLLTEDRKLHVGGTYLCMEGPAFSTRAESNFYRSLDCSIIGMTNHSEARLCREAEIAYASLCMSTDYDCWHPDHDDVTVEMILNNLNSNAELAKKIIISAAKYIGKIRPKSIAHDALKYALITPKDKIPQKTLKKINIFTKKYWQ